MPFCCGARELDLDHRSESRVPDIAAYLDLAAPEPPTEPDPVRKTCKGRDSDFLSTHDKIDFKVNDFLRFAVEPARSFRFGHEITQSYQ